MSARPEEMAAWRKVVERARQTELPGESLIDKTLIITGTRRFERRPGVLRLGAALLKLATLGMVRVPTWRLTRPGAAQTVPLRIEQAFGGECRIEADSPAAHKLPGRVRRAREPTEVRPGDASAPAAHDAFAANPAGTGFARDWYLGATGAQRVTAPRIEYPQHPVTLRHFQEARAGKLDPDAPLVAGLGVRPKGHPARARLVGTVDQHFIHGHAALPGDFDFGVWNAAWPDQQTEGLRGDDIITLTNLCAPATPAARRDALGNHVLRLALPGHLPFVLVRFENGSIGELAARLDTLLLAPDRQRVTCVWRATVATQPRVRVLEARMLTRAEAEALAQPVHPSQAKKAQETLHG